MLGGEATRGDDAAEATTSSKGGPAAELKPVELVVGKPVGGTDWVLEGALGRGGMAAVFAVVKELAAIRGAMKVPHAELVTSKEVGIQFLDEAKLYTSLKHPHIVSVMDCGVLDTGVPFMVMERLRGRTLREAMRGPRGGARTLRAAIAYEIVSCVCDALHRLHSHRPIAVVHRDVKPENIFIHEVEGVAGRGTVKLLDLGLAGQAGLRRKVLMGTPRYMAPEQIRGEGVSEHTDQYALALVLYEMLSGRLPWNVDVNNAEAMVEAHVKQPALPIARFCPWVPKGARDAIMAALSKEPNGRLPSILDFNFAVGELQHVRERIDEDSDVCITAPTAPTLASLAAYDSGVATAPKTGTESDSVRLTAVDKSTNGSVSTDGAHESEIDRLLRGLGATVGPEAKERTRRSPGAATTSAETAAAKRRHSRAKATHRESDAQVESADVASAHDGSALSKPRSSSLLTGEKVDETKDLRHISEPGPAMPRRHIARRMGVVTLALSVSLSLAVALVALNGRRASSGTLPHAQPQHQNGVPRSASSLEAKQFVAPVAVAASAEPTAPEPMDSAQKDTSTPTVSISAPAPPLAVKPIRARDRVPRPNKPAAAAASADDGREFFQVH